MLEKWISLKNNIGRLGSEGGVIQIDDELPGLARVTIELKTSPEPPGNHYAITMGVYNTMVHTVFFKKWEDAVECADTIKLIVQTLLIK